MNHKQHGNSSWYIPNRADRVPALFSGYSIETIWSDQASFILEDESGQLEGDSAMVPLISEILGLVPFLSHSVYTDCITITARCWDAARGADRSCDLSGNSAAWRLYAHVDSQNRNTHMHEAKLMSPKLMRLSSATASL